MKNHILLMRCLLIALAGLLYSQLPLSADTLNPNEDALLETMGARLPELMELKLKGLVGETNMGLLEARGTIEREQRRLLSDENRDRLAYYKLISVRLGIPVAAVQRKRAEQIRENSPKGVWLESKSGEWHRE
ncbi:DUF1318 domain-containing protein [Coraliomargarita algicola]|uniref:DUF1318 domain-containing protein n=1 Tax=Coraliomargarita algicola TaxID=3092156 RepID=A0ABZ0RK06_9BACT|nr:DUF1318 domain-containing protein [Coraliomargarita sp. J2-16]WPJ95413.1 DUF1318 domain-containing protein [Coraliomargarita sp. J2-16]